MILGNSDSIQTAVSIRADPIVENTDEMKQLGIANYPVNRFHYGEYHYTNLNDAKAQAKRDGKTG